MKVRKEILQKLHQYNEKAGVKSKVPTQDKLSKGEDSTVVLDAWRKQIVRAQKPGPRMIKRYKEQGKPIPKGDGKKFAEMIKYYLDAVEEVVKNNQEMFKKAIVDANMGDKGGYTGYDEKNIENFKVSRVFVVQDSPAYKDLKKSDIVSDLKKEKITLLPITSQQMVDYINKTNVTFASVFKEEELTEAGGDLSYLLLPVGQTQQIGAEKQDKKTKDGIERYSNKFGSYRYVMMMDGEPVGAIQVMSRDKSKGVAANVFVKPEYRRQGIAKRLLVQAKKDFDEVEYNPDQSDDGQAWVSSVSESIYKKITKESQDPSTLSSIWNVVERRDLSRLTQMMLSDDACCDTETISGLWDEADPQDAMFYLLPEPEWREWDDSDYEDEEDWTEKEMAKRREHNKGISMEEIYKSREELGQISRELLVRDSISQKSPDGSGSVVKVWRCGVTEGQPVTSVTWSEQYAYKFCTGKKAYHKDDTEVDAYYINLQDVLVSIPHIWESGYREWELLVHPKDLVPVQGYERKNNTSSISETVYNKILKGL